jgi:hypothetical protein
MPPAPSSVRFPPPSGRRIATLLAAISFTTGLTAQSSGDGFSRGSSGMDGMSAPRPVELAPVYFPPLPPPLDRPVARGSTQSLRFPAPPELAAYVSDFFYPALGTRIVTRTLSEKLKARLDAYKAARLKLQNELRTELDRLRTLEPDERTAGLAALSKRQTPQIVELEQTAEQLRRDLITSDFNWNTFRQWHLSDRQRRGYSPIEIAQVMRGYAFYQRNLLPAQRGMLREIALDLMFAAENPAAAAAANPYVFFPPEPARVLFPEDLPADLAARLAAYQTKRSALKKELYDAVYASDGATFGFLRGTPIKSVAEKQAGRIVELEALAEEIRRGLSAAPEAGVERSPLPPHLDARVATIMRRYAALQRDTAMKIDAILTASRHLPMQATYRFEGDGLKFVVVPTRGARGGPAGAGRPGGTGGPGSKGGPAGPTGAMAQVEAVRAQISAIADDYGRGIADLLNEREAIRIEIGSTLQLAKNDAIDRALFASMRVATQKENARSFSDYRTAVFEPGLSPEQRRLLFDSVMQQLDLPLPRGEPQASRRADSW